MTWNTPDLADVRRLNRDHLAAFLPGADATLPNSVLRVLSDMNAAGAHLCLLYIDYIARNLLPDQSEAEWLDRWANIYLGGRKSATFASGTIAVTGLDGVLLPAGTSIATSDGISYQTTEAVYLSGTATPAPAECLVAGSAGNRDAGSRLGLTVAVSGIDAGAAIVEMTGGADVESDDDLRARVLLRIRNTPMGGDRTDYVQWALAVPGVTRAWVHPNEMGIGTVTVRFMMDDLRASNLGFPLPVDELAVRAALDLERPVAIKDFWALAPIPHPLTVTITQLSRDTPSTRGAIERALQEMLAERAAPGATIWASWQAEAVSGALGEDFHVADYADAVMPTGGHMAVLANLYFPA